MSYKIPHCHVLHCQHLPKISLAKSTGLFLLQPSKGSKHVSPAWFVEILPIWILSKRRSFGTQTLCSLSTMKMKIMSLWLITASQSCTLLVSHRFSDIFLFFLKALHSHIFLWSSLCSRYRHKHKHHNLNIRLYILPSSFVYSLILIPT